MVRIKRAKRIRMLLTGGFILVSGVCYSVFAPKESSEFEIIRRDETSIIALTATNTPAPTAELSSNIKPGVTSKPSKLVSPTPGPQKEKVNINTASAEELMTLSGIGETRAACIVAFRRAHGEFKSIEDIMLVSGIKEGIFSKIKDRIYTGYE